MSYSTTTPATKFPNVFVFQSNDKVQAEFKYGVLCLKLPKAEEEKNKVVTINLGGQNGQTNQTEAQQTTPQAS